MKNIKYLFLFCCYIIFRYFVFAQEVEVSTYSQVYDEDLIPFEFKFYHTPRLYETPSVEFDEITLPYQKFVQPEFGKQLLTTDVLSPAVPHNEKIAQMNFGIGQSVLIRTNLFSNRGKFGISLGQNNNITNHFKDWSQYFYDAKIQQVLNSFVFTVDTKFQHDNFLSAKNLFNFEGKAEKIFSSDFSIRYTPQINYITLNNGTISKSFITNTLNGNLFVSDKVLSSVGIRLLQLDDTNYFFISGEIISNDLFLKRMSMRISIDLDKENSDWYTLAEIKYKLSFYNIRLSFTKDLYYKYLETYFISLPEITFSTNDKIYFSERKETTLGIEYRKNNCSIAGVYTNTYYTKFPTYIFDSNLVKPHFQDNITVSKLSIASNFKYIGFNNSFVLSYLIIPENTYFIPKLTSEVVFSKMFHKNFEFVQKFLYNDDIKVNIDDGISSWCVSNSCLVYKVNKNIFLNLIYQVSLANKHYLQPGIYMPEYIRFGAQIKI
ncbi:MAG: hypothetical protein N2555_03810 [Endomicrobia bacterium]|nr:hypothetical protein [Endomicrobiia bacterium]